MAGHTSGGKAAWAIVHAVPLKAATYTAGNVVQWVAASSYWAKVTTRVPGGKVIASDITIATNKDQGNVVWLGPARVLFDAVCEDGYPVWPSDATAGKAEKWALTAVSTTATKFSTAVAAQIQALATGAVNVMGHTMEEVLGTTTYYTIWVGGG